MTNIQKLIFLKNKSKTAYNNNADYSTNVLNETKNIISHNINEFHKALRENHLLSYGDFNYNSEKYSQETLDYINDCSCQYFNDIKPFKPATTDQAASVINAIIQSAKKEEA